MQLLACHVMMDAHPEAVVWFRISIPYLFALVVVDTADTLPDIIKHNC